MAKRNEKETPATKTVETGEIGGKAVGVIVIDTVQDAIPTPTGGEAFAVFELCDKGSAWGYSDYHLGGDERKRLPKNSITLKGVNDGAIREVTE